MSFSIFANRLPEEYRHLAEQKETFCHAAISWLTVFKLDNVKNNTFMGSYEGPVRRYLIPYFGAMNMTDITSGIAQEYFKSKKNQLALSSLRRHRFCLHAIFDVAVDHGHIEKTPITSYVTLSSNIPPVEKNVWAQEECNVVWEYAKKHRFGADIMMLMETAISRSELLGLTWQDFDERNGTISINNGLVTAHNPYSNQVEMIHNGLKNCYRERKMPLSKELNAALYIKKRETRANHMGKFIKHIFHAPNGGPYYPENWYKRVLKVFMNELHEQYPEIQKLTTHELRHTRASILINGNKNIFSVAELMGHRDLNMLRERYLHPDMEALRKNLSL